MAAPPRVPDHDKRSKIALGVAVICLLFLLESAQAHRVSPHPASPLLWSLLAAGGIGALVYALLCRLRLRKRRNREER
jgi:hypothetical protein